MIGHKKKYEEQVDRVMMVSNEAPHYEVWVIQFEDMPAMTYGIVNKNTGVIENIQPVLANAQTLAKQFSKWLDSEDNPDELALRLMTTGPLNS
jgi:hypothetical protein